MKFDTPATTNPIDRQRVVGQPYERIEGRYKVTGTAPFAYEHHYEAPRAAYGFIVGSAIAKGSIRRIDTSAARQVPSVLHVVTAENAGPIGAGEFIRADLLAGPRVQHYHQAIALVVAETFEAAREGASRLVVNYEEERGAFDLEAERAAAVVALEGVSDTAVGDFATAFANAPVWLDESYRTPDQAHAMMEPHASTALWEGDHLTLWTSNQMINWGIRNLAQVLGIAQERIRLVSPYVGGGFGGKASVMADALLAALGARAIRRAVKVCQTRTLMFNATTHRPATIQRVRIGAGRDGLITAIGHESWSGNLPSAQFPENAVEQTRFLYAGAHRMTALRLAALDLPEGSSMRAPGEAPGMMALEIAMDEMAERLALDPVEFRVRNDTQVDPTDPTRPFSQRHLVQCLREGAERFDWSQRNPVPGAVREGRWLVGMGVASAIRGNRVRDSGARVRLSPEGNVTVETDMTDIGTGSYTIIAQTAAEMMGLPLDRVEVALGDSRFPRAAGSAGQRGANSVTAGVYAACIKLREAVAQRLGFNSEDAEFADGRVGIGNRSVALTEATRDGEIVAEDRIEFGEELARRFEQQTFGAQFAEVTVDRFTAEIRVRRMLAVCDAGRILNPRLARFQVIGAMTMGIGAALMEELAVDRERGFFANHDLATYEVPVHADILSQEVIFLDHPDPMSSPIKAKGISELGLTGVAAAIANAVYNATGIRVREYPIMLEKLAAELPAA
ncbi:xanthine dehydrogenase family protein molybdopterin-binding subunit [Aureimonas altamirensis]|uniref:aldehyde oxidoreductase molybdenum-binding subunit PaoC n=1 Tax=Aureimonas altamirensis TaxID=370622 RepID=UPI001E5F3BCE|nr:aldehyde oxidoreductase molybdenum-binding subunit PaoC [Aureimonas altamirensis]UHD46401.1 xanthine dehydrogenase family protein molybdopterin-binding subunit [Aureimonas altamirensis]